MVRADRGDVELGEPLGRLARGHAGERLGALVEGHQRDDRQARDAAHRLDRVDELLEVVERLDHEEVGAAALEDAAPARRRARAATRADADSPSGPIEPAMNTSRPEISRASRASLTAAELIRSKSSSRNRPASLRRLAPKVFVSIRSAPALMKLTWSETTASGARRFASSGVRRRGTAAVISEPMPPSATMRRAGLQPGQKPVRHAVKLSQVERSSTKRVMDQVKVVDHCLTSRLQPGARCGGAPNCENDTQSTRGRRRRRRRLRVPGQKAQARRGSGRCRAQASPWD